MGLKINDLPLNMQRQALQKMQGQQKSKSVPKYHNEPDTRGNLKFDSKKEAQRFDELSLMLKAGIIAFLQLQANFTLQEGYTTPDGLRIKPIIYKADFVYVRDDGKLIVEDVKSEATKTKTYLMKKKMLNAKYGIEITEV